MRLSGNIFLAALAVGACGFDRVGWLVQRTSYGRKSTQMRETFRTYAAKVDTPATDVDLPIEMFEDGTVKTLVTAKEAQYFVTEGMIWARDVDLKQFERSGELAAVIRAKECVIDRNRKVGWAEGPADADYGPHHIDGADVYFELETRYFRVNRDVKLVSRDFKVAKSVGEKAKDSATGKKDKAQDARPSTLVCRRADYDNAKGVILFDADVRIDDAEFHLTSDRVWVLADGTNAVRTLIAEGCVRVTNENRTATCSVADFDNAAKRLVMHAGAREPARIVERGKNTSEIAGETIVFWTESEQVEVERPVVTIEMQGGIEWKKTSSQGQ